MIKIKPFYAVVYLYVFVNLLFLILGLCNNNIVNMEFESFYITTPILFFSFALQFFSVLFLIFLYILFSGKDFNSNNLFGNISSIFLLTWQLLFLIFALIWGLGVVGSEPRVSQILVIVSNFLSADIFYILMAPSLKSNKFFYINTGIYLISSLIRGWIGGALIAFFVYMCRVGYLKISMRMLVFYILIFVFVVASSPFLIDLKIAIRTGEEFNIDVKNYSDKLELAIDYLLGRFQHLGHTALLLNNVSEYRDLYDSNKILPFWLEGIPQNFLYKLLGNNALLTYSNMMAVRDFGAYSGEAWNANTGLSGWLILLGEKSIFFLIYWSVLIISFFSFVYKYGNRQTFNVISVFMIIYLYHGWLGAFFNLMLLAFVIIFLKKIKLNTEK